MRAFLVAAIIALATLSAAPPASAVLGGSATTAVHVRDLGTFLTWAPAPLATGYDIYRQVDDGPMEHIATTSATFLFDGTAPSSSTLIYTFKPFSAVPGVTYRSGSCVVADPNNADVSITVSNCGGASNPRFAD